MDILIVDDCVTVRQIVAAVVEHEGHRLIEASSGAAALELLDAHRPDLILMDVNLPGLSGFETTRLIRQRLKQDWIPIIFLTSQARDADFAAGIDAGGDDYLVKPVRPIVLKAKLLAMERLATMRQDLQRLNRELNEAALVDGLTGIPNRRSFAAEADRLWREGRDNPDSRLSVLMVDVDQFKRVNDRLGHAVGDKYLKQVAACVRGALRTDADFVARYGGEEFVVLLPDTNATDAQTVAERIRGAVESNRLSHPESSVAEVVTVSVGVATSPAGCRGMSFHELCQQADAALYAAKNAGRNRVATAADEDAPMADPRRQAPAATTAAMSEDSPDAAPTPALPTVVPTPLAEAVRAREAAIAAERARKLGLGSAVGNTRRSA